MTAEYAIKFHTLVAQSGWNAPSLMAVFCEGLNRVLKVDMACRKTNVSLSHFINTTICLDNLCRQHQPSTAKLRHTPEHRVFQSDYAEPMKLGRA